MLFSSLEFIFLFLPITLLVYYISPNKIKNAVLFVSGIVFYAFGEIKLLPIFLVTIAVDFGFGLLIEKCAQRRKIARALLILSVIFNLALLGYFKYFDFFRGAIFGLSPIGILLPVGISFYTFQALSYVIDVYRREVKATKNIINFGAYISLFPQLIAGPIVKYNDIERQLTERFVSGTLIANGLRRFICGLSKKVILANGAGELFEFFCEGESYLSAIFTVFFFGMQIYFDFSGYSDMAIGLGRMLGFEFIENFNYPYISKSVSEFWRRWHISLSSFFKEYVYIPLGGSKRGKLRLAVNLFIVWSLTGIWHGASWNFLLWGGYFGLILIIEKLAFAKILNRMPKILSLGYSLFLVFLGWLIFASDGVTLTAEKGISVLSRLFFVSLTSFAAEYELFMLSGAIPFIFILVIGSTSLPRRIYLTTTKKLSFLSAILPFSAFVLSVAYIVSSGYNPFLYFRF
ncbi:MAG: MBOAT family protein [Ruminococcaceae bacterium]|nr:MBOAT family protein [Oscillospiraceae bacterium]